MQTQDIDAAIAEMNRDLAQGATVEVLNRLAPYLAAAPGRAELWYLAGKAHAQEHRWSAAFEHALRAVSLAPTWLHANALALVLLQHGASDGELPEQYDRWRKSVASPQTLIDACTDHPDRYVLFSGWSTLATRMELDELAVTLFGLCLAPAGSDQCGIMSVESDDAAGAEHYDDDRIHLQSAEGIADYVVPLLKPDSVIVDSGCGSGLAGRFLRPPARRLIGIDMSPHMAQICRDRGIYDEVITGDMIRVLAGMPDTADAVVCLGCAYYLEDIRPFLAAARNALKPGGRLLLIDHPAPAGSPVMQTIGGTLRYCRSADLLQAQAAQAGFAAEEPMLALYFNLPAYFWSLRAV